MSISRSRRRPRLLGAAAFVSVVAFSSAAWAGPRPSGPAHMPVGAAAAAPSGFLDFCERTPGECASPDERVNLADIRAQANALYWAGVFGKGAPQRVSSQTASTGAAAGGFDWSRVFPQRAQPLAVADPQHEGQALAMEDMAAPAVEEAAAAGVGAPSAEDFGRDVAAHVRDFRRPLSRQPSKPAPAPVARAPRIEMSEADWKRVRAINRDVNRSIRSGADERVYGVDDFWTIPGGSNSRGDCEDYVLAKRRALVRAGYPMDALSIAVVETRWGEVHAVLLLATAEGEFVLDNLNGRIQRWDRVGYRWRERQAPGRTFDWVRIGA